MMPTYIERRAPIRAWFISLILTGMFTVTMNAETDDPYLWLEEVQGETALDWVRKSNAQARESLTQNAEFTELQGRIKAVLDSQTRIPYLSSQLGDLYYNFWQDESNSRGILRRTSLDEYRKETPNWEVVLDVDQLGEIEGESWVYKGSLTLRPTYDRSLVQLSRGGSDAAVVREFDLVNKVFVADGFTLPEAKSDVSWLNQDEVIVATDFGEGSLTESGYPRIVKRWKRDTPIEEATVLFTGETTDVGAFGYSDQTRDFERAGVHRALDFYNSETYVLIDDELVKIDKPDHASASFFREWILIEPKKDWQIASTTYVAGSLLAFNLSEFIAGSRDLHVLFKPTPRRSLAGFTATRNYLLLNVLDNVRNQIEVLRYQENEWQSSSLADQDQFQTISIRDVNENENDDYFITRSDFLTPPSFGIGTIKGTEESLRSEPTAFSAPNYTISQHWVKSKDGEQIPYFQVSPQQIDAPLPTLLYGYGGFEVSLVPNYQKITGTAWLAAGGIYVVANIRGGGEFGPQWHRSALKENRYRAYDDFIAVAEDLIARGVTTSDQLGASGGSNGGLLIGNMVVRRPDLFGALVINVPLLDMKRYHLLLAGASWVAEYGDPDIPEEWEYLKNYSPYQNLSKTADYPPLLVTTSTADDRVHPGHARKFVARLREFGKDVTYYENLEGGHAGAADNTQRAFMSALQYRFLWDKLGDVTDSD